MHRVSVVLPVYNEASVLKDSVKKVLKYMNGLGFSYEIIIAADGSTDGTSEIADELSSNYSQIIVSNSRNRLGRGRALKKSFRMAKSKYMIYFDIDLSTSLDSIKDAIDCLDKGFDICIGSRLLPASKTKRCLKREMSSRGYNMLGRFLFNSKITDFQCGFKAFSKDTLPIILESKNNHWFWDTEVLIRAEKRGKKICQIPVEWVEDRKTKVNIFRCILGMGSRMLKLRFSLL